jgi:hypothetical protein
MNNLFLVGINSYQNLTHLFKCLNDISAFKEILLEKFEFEEQQVIELTNASATFESVSSQLEKYTALGEDDTLIIYFSGHGGQFDQEIEEGYWALYNTNNKKNALSFNDIVKKLERINCKHILIISDSCYSRSLLNAWPNVVGKIRNKRTEQEEKYENLKSRYVITSGSFATYEGGEENSTNVFNQKLIQYLKESDKDFRVSELSEYLKNQFKNNSDQKPQSSFINDKNNKYGEFLFKIAEDYNDPNPELLGFGDFETLIKQISPNLKHIKTDSHYDSDHKIGFQIVTMFDDDIKRIIYYIFLYQGINQKKTVNYIKQNFPDLYIEHRDKIILIPKEKQKYPEIRKNNIQTKFLAKSVFYIDEYISKRTLRNSNYFDDYIPYAPRNFVSPVLECSDELFTKDLSKWFEKTSKSVLVIKGEGGIGKTTLAGFLSDSFQSQNKEIRSVIFIECKRIRSELIRLFHYKQTLNLYDLYEAYINKDGIDQYKLTYDLFRINIDSGNLLLVLDGLDELISHVQNFDVNDFIASIIIIKREFQKSKIIITCRTYFWNKTSINNDLITEITVRPFDESQAQEFFQKYFTKDLRKIENCRRIAKEFESIDNNKIFYLPYVLDVIRTIIESEGEVLTNEMDEKSAYLQLRLKKDYVIFRACSREKKKLNDLTVDNQIFFFIHLSLNRRGIINIESLDNELFHVFNKHFDSSQIESFKSHILLKVDDKKLLYKYDFFADLFKSIYFSKEIINNKLGSVSDQLLEFITDNFWFNSGVLIDIIERINIYPSELMFDVLSIFDYLIQQDKRIQEKYKCFSGLFNLLLRLNHKFRSNSINHNTDLLNELFQRGDCIELLSLMDIFNDEEIRFDFSGKILKNCNFNNYRSFWNCGYDENTKFVDCSFFNLNYARINKEIAINIDNIYNPICDDDFKEFLKNNPLYKTSQEVIKQDFLKDFLKMFVKSGNITVLSDDRIKHEPTVSINECLTNKFSKIKNVKTNLDEMINIGMRIGLIVPFINPKNKRTSRLSISMEYRTDVISFVMTNTPSKIIIDYYKLIK